MEFGNKESAISIYYITYVKVGNAKCTSIKLSCYNTDYLYCEGFDAILYNVSPLIFPYFHCVH